MIPCFAHNAVHCAVCKCIKHRVTDCIDQICKNERETKTLTSFLSQPLHQVRGSLRTVSPVNSKLSSQQSNSTSGTNIVNSTPSLSESGDSAELIKFLKQQNAQLQLQIQDLTNQLKILTEKLSVPDNQQQGFVTPSVKRKNSKGAEDQRKKVHSIAAKNTNNRFELLSEEEDTDESTYEPDLTLGSDEEVFQSPSRSNNPVIKKAAKRVQQRQEAQQRQHQQQQRKTVDKAIEKGKKNTTLSTPSSQQPTIKIAKVLKPPPIITATDTDFVFLCNVLKNVDRTKWSSKILPQNCFKINPLDDDTHAVIIKSLKENNLQHNTYENKNRRPIRVMAKGLHHSISPNEILEDLTLQGFKPIDAINIIRKDRKPISKNDTNSQITPDSSDLSPSKSNAEMETAEKSNELAINTPATGNDINEKIKDSQEPPPIISENSPDKEAAQAITIPTTTNPNFETIITPLNLFAISFEKSDDIEKIFEIKTIANMLVVIEPVRPNPKTTLVQCKACQAFDHTAKYCNYTPHCVRCAQEHLTTDCPLPKFIPNPKCANCGQNHPANYLGCLIAKEVTQEKKATLKRALDKKINTKTEKRLQQVPTPKTTLKKGVSFRDTLREPNLLDQREFPALGKTQNNAQSPPSTSQGIQLQQQPPSDMELTLTKILSTLTVLTERVAKLENQRPIRAAGSGPILRNGRRN